MKKCGIENCNKTIDDSYKFCYEHRRCCYIDTCKIHGSVEFKQGKCIDCLQLMKPIYRIYKRDGKFYLGRKLAKLDHPLYEYFNLLIHRNRPYAMRFINPILNGSGTYGIFKKGRGNSLGRCMYIGQSINIKCRVDQHIEKISMAQNKFPGLPTMYYNLSDIGLPNLKFMKLISIDKIMEIEQLYECLSILEQYSMDCFQPELNVIAARNTEIK